MASIKRISKVFFVTAILSLMFHMFWLLANVIGSIRLGYFFDPFILIMIFGIALAAGIIWSNNIALFLQLVFSIAMVLMMLQGTGPVNFSSITFLVLWSAMGILAFYHFVRK